MSAVFVGQLWEMPDGRVWRVARTYSHFNGSQLMATCTLADDEAIVDDIVQAWLIEYGKEVLRN